VTVIPDANVVRLETDQQGRIKSAIYATADKVEHACKANTFVLAAGAVETSRVLLLSGSSGRKEGLANSSGLVGRYLIEHPGRFRWGKVDYPLFPNRAAFFTIETAQYDNKKDRDKQAAFSIAGLSSGHLDLAVQGVLDQSGNWGASLEREIRERIRDEFGRIYMLGSQIEPMPMESNRVELDPEVKDYFGNPCPRIFYDIHSYEKESIPAADKVMENIFNAMGAKIMNKSETKASGGHFGGTCRMGNDPKKSVVDKNLKANDVSNLYITGQSVMVTEGCSNPTLTNAALSLRLADHLIRTRGR
jgi:choline dehydrogenase-like flavoprotein